VSRVDAHAREFFAVGVGVAFGTFGAGAQVGAEFFAFPSRLSAELRERVLGVGADPLGFSASGSLGCLGAGGVLLSVPGLLVGLVGALPGGIPLRFGSSDPLVSFGAGLLDRRIPVGFSRRDPVGSFLAGLLDASVTVGFSGRAGGLGLVCAGLGGGELGGHLFGGGVSLGAELVSLSRALLGGCGPRLGGHGPLLGGGADGFQLDFGGGGAAGPRAARNGQLRHVRNAVARRR
jgi:hypothetical protein